MTLIKITLTDGSILIRRGSVKRLDHFGKLYIGNALIIPNVATYSNRVKPGSKVLYARHKRLGAKLYNSPQAMADVAQKMALKTKGETKGMWERCPAANTIRTIANEGLSHPEWMLKYLTVEVAVDKFDIHAPQLTQIMTVCPECGGYPTDREGAEMGDGGVFEKVDDCDKCTTGGKDYIAASEVIEGEDYVLETGKDSEVATCTQTAEIKRDGLTYHVARFGGVTVTELQR